MGAKDLLLDIAGAEIVMEVEPGLANPDDLRVRRQRDQLARREFRMIGRLMRMGPDRAPDPVMRLGDRPHRRELVEAGADRQHRADPGGAGARDHRVALGGEIRKIEMAMAVDQHRPLPSLRSRAPRSLRQSAGRCRAAWATRVPAASGVRVESRKAPRIGGHRELVEQPRRRRRAQRAASGSRDAASPRRGCRAPSRIRVGSVRRKAHGACSST